MTSFARMGTVDSEVVPKIWGLGHLIEVNIMPMAAESGLVLRRHRSHVGCSRTQVYVLKVMLKIQKERSWINKNMSSGRHRRACFTRQQGITKL